MSINSNKCNKRKKGFTLVEILAVILVIGLLFVMLVPRLSSMDEASRQAGVKTKFKEFQNAAKTVLLENAGLSKVMSSDTDVASLVTVLNKELDDANQFDASTIQGQYCDSVAKDPWNNHYRLHVNGNTITFISYGSNPVTVHAAEFNYVAENCKYILVIIYEDGRVLIKTEGFTVNIEDDTSGDNAGVGGGGNTGAGEGGNQIASTPEDCFAWDGTTITGFSGTCGHTDEEHENIVIPERCTAIGDRAFRNCYRLTSVTITNNVTNVGIAAFYECGRLASVTIPNSVTSIGSDAFYNCNKLTSVTIPGSITEIAIETFCRCSSLQSVTIQDGVTTIGQSAFNCCTSLTSITIPNSITRIYDGAFEDCTSLTSITIPSSLTYIGRYAFSGCSSLTRAVIPDSVTCIGRSAFSVCTSLTSVTISSRLTEIDSDTFSHCSSLQNVTIPNSIKSIGPSAFDGCTSLTSVTIPNSVTRIWGYAFRNVPHIEYHGRATGEPWGALSMN